MRRTPCDWLLERDRDALPRLDAIRQTVLAPERATLEEAVVEAFRQDRAAWAAMACVWLVLAAAHFAVSPDNGSAPKWSVQLPDLAALTLSPDEAIPPLDRHS
jgi:hypothetical protein